MSRIIKNTIASFGGSALAAVLNIIFFIAYFRLLGGEGYGLVIFCTTILYAATSIVESGFARTTTRELARREHAPDLAHEMRDVLFTMQSIHFGLTLVCALIIVGSSHWLASEWLQRDTVNIDEAVRAIMLVGGIAVLQFPRSVFNAALTGLHRQVFLNICSLVFVLMRGVVTILALLFVSASPTMFLLAQLIVAGIEMIVLFISTWRLMPKAGRRARFEVRHLKETWVFSSGDAGAMLVGVAIGIGDRMVLSSILPLETFGTYGLVTQLAEVIQRVVGPFTGAYFPYFVDLITRKDHERLSREYHRITIIINALMIPAACIIVFFPMEILQIVSGKASVATEFAPVLAVRTLATAINATQWFPHILQLATGLSTFLLVVSIFTASIYLSGIILLTPIYGVIAPAALWLLVNIFQMAPMIIMTHRRALLGETWTWIEGSLLRPTLITLVIVLISRYFAPTDISWFVTIPWLAMTYLVAVTAVLIGFGTNSVAPYYVMGTPELAISPKVATEVRVIVSLQLLIL